MALELELCFGSSDFNENGCSTIKMIEIYLSLIHGRFITKNDTCSSNEGDLIYVAIDIWSSWFLFNMISPISFIRWAC